MSKRRCRPDEMQTKKLCDVIGQQPSYFHGNGKFKNGGKKLTSAFVEENEKKLLLSEKEIFGVKFKINIVQNIKMYNCFNLHSTRYLFI